MLHLSSLIPQPTLVRGCHFHEPTARPLPPASLLGRNLFLSGARPKSSDAFLTIMEYEIEHDHLAVAVYSYQCAASRGD